MNVKVLARCSALTLSLFMCLGFAYQAHAISVTGSAGPNFPVEVEVGQSYTRFYQMVNTSTDDSGNPLAGNVEATDIRMTPSCGSTNNPNFCDAGSEDNGVFAPLVFSGSSLAAPCDLAPCGLGRTGTACAGNRFAISVVAGAINTASDEWLFTPLDGDVLLGTPLTADALCTIDFDMEVLMLPTIDSRGDTGIQTDLKGTADYLHIPTQTQGAGQGGSFTTVIGCGDGVVQTALGETCDPSVFVDPGDWLASVPPVFGDLADLRDCREPGTTGECTYCGDDDVQVVDAGPPPFEACDDGNSVNTDDCTNECLPGACSVEIDKQVALDDNCDGVADGPFGDLVTQDEDECVVYEICVTNTGQQVLNTGGVEVSDTHLGIVSVDFGTIGVGGEECKFVASEVTATDCPGGVCVCENVEGVNTAEITSAICQGSGANACDQAGSDCDDIAEVVCVSCSVEIDKQVALDDDCDGVADGPFGEDVTQDPDKCVVYEICVTNTGEQVLNTGGVEVSDTHLGIVDLDFGTIGVGGEECKLVASEASAEACVDDICVCEDVEGVNTAVVTSAICELTGKNACADEPPSDCDDTAEVDCAKVVGICRTPGFWGTHGCPQVVDAAGNVLSNDCDTKGDVNITQEVIDAGGGCLEVCGEVITNTAVWSENSALEAICSTGANKLVKDVYGANFNQLARQLTAAALNFVISGTDESGTGLWVDEWFDDCNNLCAGGVDSSDPSVNECIYAIDCFNNGWVLDDSDNCVPPEGVCVSMSEQSDIACTSDDDCTAEYPYCNADNCHERLLCNLDLDDGICFEWRAESGGLDCDDPSAPVVCLEKLGGNTGSSKICNEAKKITPSDGPTAEECLILWNWEEDCPEGGTALEGPETCNGP